MAETIEQLVAKLNRAFQSDVNFDAAMKEAESSNLTKEYVVALYNRLCGTQRKFSASVSKPDLYNAIRRERIARVRARD